MSSKEWTCVTHHMCDCWMARSRLLLDIVSAVDRLLPITSSNPEIRNTIQYQDLLRSIGKLEDFQEKTEATYHG